MIFPHCHLILRTDLFPDHVILLKFSFELFLNFRILIVQLLADNGRYHGPFFPYLVLYNGLCFKLLLYVILEVLVVYLVKRLLNDLHPGPLRHLRIALKIELGKIIRVNAVYLVFLLRDPYRNLKVVQ